MSDFMRPSRVANLTPTTQNYPALVKTVLRRRLKHILLLVGVAVYGALLLAVFDPKELPRSLFNAILPAMLFSPLALLGTIPLLVLRKQTLTTALSSSPTFFSQILILRQFQTFRILLAYLIGGTFLFFSYLFTASAVSREPVLGLFFYHKGRDAHMLNERWIYLSGLHFTLAVWATVQHVLYDRSHIAFDTESSLTIPARLSASLRPRLSQAIRTIFSLNIVFFFTYLVARRPFLRVLVLNLAGVWARPYLYALMRSNGALSITLIVRALTSTFLTLTAWEVTHVCFTIYVTQPVSVSHFARNPQQCLLSGLRSTDPYYQHFAFLELATLTRTNPARRKAIFTELKADGAAGGTWQEIARESLKLIGTELQRAKGRGRIATSAPSHSAPSSSTSSASSNPRLGTASPVKNENIFRPSKKTFFDSLLTPAPSAPQGTSSAVAPTSSSSSSSTTTSRVPSVFQAASSNQSSSAAPTAASAAAPAQSAASVGLEERLAGWVPQKAKGHWFGDVFGVSDRYRVGVCVVNRRPAIWAIEALANMLCASLSEDPYGVAQRDIPRVLEGFVLYLSALESLSASFGSDSAAVIELVEPIEIALKNGTKAVLDEFTPYLDSLAFPPKIAAKLQILLDWG